MKGLSLAAWPGRCPVVTSEGMMACAVRKRAAKERAKNVYAQRNLSITEIPCQISLSTKAGSIFCSQEFGCPLP